MARTPQTLLTLAVLATLALPVSAFAQAEGEAGLGYAAGALDQASAAAPTSSAVQADDDGPPSGAIGGVVVDLATVPYSSLATSRWNRPSRGVNGDEWLAEGHRDNSAKANYMAQRVVDPHGRRATGFNATRARGARWNRRATLWFFHDAQTARPESPPSD